MTPFEAANWIRERDNFTVVTHRRPDGDTLGCAAALVIAMREAGKTAFVMQNAEVTDRYMEYMGQYFAPDGYVPEHYVAVDIASEGLFPKGHSEELTGKVGLCIDHHPSNTFYAENTCLDAECAACGELMYDVIMELNGIVSPDAAKQLYIAISTDTGCFSYGNTTARTFDRAAKVAFAGAPIGTLNKEIFRTKSKSRIALEGHVFSEMEFFCGGLVAAVCLPKKLLDSFGVEENDLEDIASLPGIVEGVEASMIIRELADGRAKVSLRSGPKVNCNEICKKFGGGGHAMASGCTLELPIDEVKNMFVSAIAETL